MHNPNPITRTVIKAPRWIAVCICSACLREGGLYCREGNRPCIALSRHALAGPWIVPVAAVGRVAMSACRTGGTAPRLPAPPSFASCGAGWLHTHPPPRALRRRHQIAVTALPPLVKYKRMINSVSTPMILNNTTSQSGTVSGVELRCRISNVDRSPTTIPDETPLSGTGWH